MKFESSLPKRLRVSGAASMLSADVVEAQLRHERNVGVIGVAVGLRSRVVARLRKPFRRIDAVTQMLRTGERDLHFCGTILSEWRYECRGHNKEQGKHKTRTQGQGSSPW